MKEISISNNLSCLAGSIREYFASADAMHNSLPPFIKALMSENDLQ